jgi:hypothetical protein
MGFFNPRISTMTTYRIVEKKNHLAVHAICGSKESAQRWLDVTAFDYCARGYFMDKSLTPDSFEIQVRPQVTLARNPVNGAWQAQTMHKGYLVQQQYYGYTKAEAEAEFQNHLENLK